MVSRIIRDKGIIEYISASKFFKKNKKIKFYLAGDFDKSNPSRINKVKFKSLMKSSNVIYLGHKKIYSDLCQSIRVLFYHHIERFIKNTARSRSSRYSSHNL